MRRLLSWVIFNPRSRSPAGLRLIFAFVALALWSAPSVLLAASFTATLDRSTMTLGESVNLSLTFTGGQPQAPPRPPAIPNLQFDYLGPSSQFTLINGQVSSTVTHNFTVTPHQAGDYTIPSLTAEVGSEKLHTEPVSLKVLKPGAPPPEAISSGSQLAFVKLVLPKKQLYFGEVVTAELHLYLRNEVRSIDHFQLTAFPAEGFNVGKLVQGNRQQARVGNSVYTVIPVVTTLKPVKTGPLTIGPVTVSVVLEVASANRRRGVFGQFDDFPSWFPGFGGGEQKQLSLATEQETLQILGLPGDNVPPGFNGAVGSFTMAATAGPTNLAAGDPITLHVQISGRGALDSLALPDQSTWRDFKTYPPTTKVDTTDALGLQGTKTFEQVVVPQSPDIKALPPISFSFFDPDQKSYRTLTQPAVPLVVRPGGSAPAPTVAATTRTLPDNPPPAQDIVHIKPRLGTVAQIAPPLVLQPWFLAFQAVPVLAWLSAVVWRRRTEMLANNPRLRRRRQVAQIIRQGLLDLRQLASDKKSDDFFATLFRLLQEQLGERLDLPASAITEAVIEEHLRPRGVPEATLASLHELFQACNLARYAPVKTSQELAAIIPKFEAMLRELQGLKT
ncbi:MAG: BatD family protein [Limisphaerales bacterium]